VQSAPQTEDDEPPFAAEPVVTKPASGNKAEDILAMIRARQNKQ